MQENGNTNLDDEIDLWQVAAFFVEHFKSLVLGGLIAAVLSLGGWYAFAPWKAELVLNVEKGGNGAPSIDFLTWRNYSQNLPFLAQQWADSGLIKDAALVADYKPLGNLQWWQQNVTPNFALTKNDTRNLFSVSKQLQDSSSDMILSLSINGTGRHPEDLTRRLNLAADFIVQGGAYLTIKSLLGSYQIEVGQEGELSRQILQNEIELGYLRQRANKTEQLRARFPQSKGISSQQVLEIKENNSKYMPVESQLIAIYADIDMLNERNLRLNEQLKQTQLKGDFLKSVLPLLETETNGLQLITRILDIPLLKQDSKEADSSLRVTVANIRQDLVAIHSRFSRGLTKSPPSKPVRPGPLLPLVGGFLGGGFLMLLWLLLKRGWQLHHPAKG